MTSSATLVTFSLGLFASVMTANWMVTSGMNIDAANQRLFVMKNLLDETADTVLVFRVSNGNLQYSSTTSETQPYLWSKWVDIGSPAGGPDNEIYSNPVGTHTSKKQIQMFVQSQGGQVYTIQQLVGAKTISFGSWAKLPLLEHQTNVNLNSRDSVTAGKYRNQTVVFARTVAKESALCWCRGSDGGKFSTWETIGSVAEQHLLSDATVIFNAFSGYYEAFTVMSDGYVYRTWQRDDQRWADWRSMGIFQPKVATTSRPVANTMSHAFGNGVLEVFFAGADGTIKHIFQTTCDRVDNPWGYCTWGVWHTISGKLPKTLGTNIIATGQNIHLGGELFAADVQGILWHCWQLNRGSSWSAWQEVSRFPPSKLAISGKPFVSRNDKSWWKVFALSENGSVIVVEQARSLEAKPVKVTSGSNLTVNWSVPVDEATGMDWIGLYPTGASNDEYIDFKYVQGGQNPTSSPVPKGEINLTSYLPDGRYDVRYLVNRQFVNVIDKSVEYSGGSLQEPWVQVYMGIFRGLGTKTAHFKECVQDGNKTVATFRQSFKAFQNKELYKGLQMMGLGLKDVQETLVACLETDIAKALEKFVQDLISCVEGKCLNFVIDELDILLILYEDVYEIFGDIRAASNSFNVIQAYEQGGLCIGRVVNACISLPPLKV